MPPLSHPRNRLDLTNETLRQKIENKSKLAANHIPLK